MLLDNRCFMKTFSMQNDLMNMFFSSVDQQRFLYLLKNSRVSAFNQNYVCFVSDSELKSAVK